jgi:hypothetical protein
LRKGRRERRRFDNAAAARRHGGDSSGEGRGPAKKREAHGNLRELVLKAETYCIASFEGVAFPSAQQFEKLVNVHLKFATQFLHNQGCKLAKHRETLNE